MNNPVTICRHNEQLAPHFKSLNEEWLERLFEIEAIDQKVLSNPQQIINDGGQILYAQMGDDVVGCVALKHHGDKLFELTKMAVTASHQKHGIGAILLRHCIQEFGLLSGHKLYLETHSSLLPAIKLYARHGFVKMPHPFDSVYARSDYYMEYTD